LTFVVTRQQWLLLVAGAHYTRNTGSPKTSTNDVADRRGAAGEWRQADLTSGSSSERLHKRRQAPRRSGASTASFRSTVPTDHGIRARPKHQSALHRQPWLHRELQAEKAAASSSPPFSCWQLSPPPAVSAPRRRRPMRAAEEGWSGTASASGRCCRALCARPPRPRLV
jgi:hypothetical protein